MVDIKMNKNQTNLKKNQPENSELDINSFDESLRLIEKTLKNLNEKIEPINNLDEYEDTQQAKASRNNEHIIDNTHLNMDKLHDFHSVQIIKKNYSFGFYTYLALIIGIIFLIYEILNHSKDLIISEYPVSEAYIEYFYEVIEILAYVVMNTITFIKNLF